MKKSQSILALSLGALFTLSLCVGCADGNDVGGVQAPIAARICFDNLPDDNISIAEEDTRIEIANVESRIEYNAAGSVVSEGTVAKYENGVLSAISEGTVKLTLKGGDTFRVEVVPAYVTNSDNRFSGTASDYTQGGSLLGGTHDPSLIEVEEEGKPAYYIFSTGWEYGNEIRRSIDLIHWEYMGKATKATTIMPDVDAWISKPNSQRGISWWAPDIVPAYGGGYWLYTCCVTDGYDIIDGIEHSKACIVLFKSNTLEAESFRYVGVLMQSSIPNNSEGAIDINSIDPQIIFSPDGKMYMAYGSFGTGNWMLELDPKTGLRKDGVYKDGKFYTHEKVREYRDDAIGLYSSFKNGDEVVSEYYGTMISQGAMEAPVIARHDNVTVSDESGNVLAQNKTFYYSMHSYNGLDEAYQMWGGRSENPMGRYLSVGEAGVPFNVAKGNNANMGNKYMGSFTWANKTGGFEPDIVLPGHNDLFTTSDGVNIAAYITRTASYGTGGRVFMSQIHQYYLNSFGDICINPNRYGKEIDRTVTKEELFAFTDGGKFKMVCLENGGHSENSSTISVNVVMTEDGKITYEGAEFGTWQMYGKGYIKFSITNREAFASLKNAEETIYYGVVRPSWLNDQNKSGFTITCMGHTGSTRSMAMFMNNYSTLEV